MSVSSPMMALMLSLQQQEPQEEQNKDAQSQSPLGQQLLSQFAGGSSGTNTSNQLNGILAALGMLKPTEGLPQGASIIVNPASTSSGSTLPSAASSQTAAAQGAASANPLSSVSSLLGLGKNGSSLLSSILGTGSLPAAAAADTNAATSAVSGLNVANDGTGAAAEASNDAALGALPAGNGSEIAGLLNSGDYTGAAGAALGSSLGDVTADGTAAAVEAGNDAALAAADGGAAGAGAGADAGAASLGFAPALGVLGLGALGIGLTGGLNPQTLTDTLDTALTKNPASGYALTSGGQNAVSAANATGATRFGSSAGQSIGSGTTPSTAFATYNGQPFIGNENTAAQLWNAYTSGTGTLSAYQNYMKSYA